jgi:cyclopropane fatty-acyl-phospholipid synthase-like methyltransferase
MPEQCKANAPSCERNREPILAVLRDHFMDRSSVLEIGSGTGQHAAYFARELPHLIWQATDRKENLTGIAIGLAEAGLPNAPAPIELDVRSTWPKRHFDAAFSANTLHIMSWPEAERMFTGLGGVLTDKATLIIYGPFNYAGHYTSQSNASFDAWLKARGKHQGIRDFEAVADLAANLGFQLVEDRAMPANNRCLVWQRIGARA